ncbi:MAG: restriction endonuclease subunit S [Gammaproteobacteria bacterium]
MSMSWQQGKLGDFVEFKYGKGLPERVRSPGNYKVYGSGGVVGSHNTPLVSGPGIVVGRKGTVGSVYWENDDFFPIDTTFYVLPKTDIQNRFAFYLLKSLPLQDMNTDAAVPGLNRNNAFRLDVNIPPNNKRIELLEESARQLYKEWFVRFRFPGHEHVKIIDGVPEGWERCTASQALDVNPKVFVEKGKEILYVPMASLSESQMTVDASRFERREKHTTVKFKHGDTLFARITPCLENGKTAYVNFLDKNEVACGSTEFIVLRGNKVSNQFAYLLSREESFRGNAIKSMIGSSGRQRVQPSCFDKYIVAVAPSTIQEQFDEVVGLAFKQIGVLINQNNQLAKARDLLLPKLMSGEIAV